MLGLSPSGLDRVAVVLVRARNPNNIGAAARAMHDLGFGQMRVVNDYPVPFQAARSAVDAGEILAAAGEFTTLAQAIADCTLVLGTTAVGERVLEHPLLPLREAADQIRLALCHPGARVALLFGSEKTGLSNEELSHCHGLLTIPMRQYEDLRHPSMNLGQAVAVCLYELTRDLPLLREPGSRPTADSSNSLRTSSAQLAPSSDQIERLTTLLRQVLSAAEYDRHHPANAAEADLRRLVLRSAMSAVDLHVWLGMLRQILWKLQGGTRPDGGDPSRL